MKPRDHAAGEPPRAAAAAMAAAALFRAPAPVPAPANPDDPFGSVPPVATRARHDGWTAQRQRIFLTALSETGSISEACNKAGVSSRSAYRLRARPDAAAFAKAWDDALRLATARLTALAFERATRGTVREIWRNGELHTQTREPSDRLLVFLLQHLLPAGRPGERWAGFEAMAETARAAFPATLAALPDNPCQMIPISSRDFFPPQPGDQDEDV